MQNQTASLANQMKHRDREMVPRFLVIAMFSLMAASVALVGYARLTDMELTGVAPDSPVINERLITLAGARSEGFAVLTEDGTQIAHSKEAKNGFIDVIAVSIGRERLVNGITTNEPLRLVRRENGHVAVIDPATDWKIELVGYGVDNVAAFARLID
ncbi:photosynthetic complex assembly protein PuhC [uncultured Litoreibacter sp.]|uniref:photosynthetic complex assembly protein PuhC n=1 Tax=uncultured Litoreibacter sp. TaxID=1392394 RepID=UPI00261F593C|nr:photosynthetic complex assembly protein PuhC [uncultured Litoreibacter sp.]